MEKNSLFKMRLNAAQNSGLDSSGSRRGLHVKRTERSVLNSNVTGALSLVSKCFPSGVGEKSTSTTTKYDRKLLIPKTPNRSDKTAMLNINLQQGKNKRHFRDWKVLKETILVKEYTIPLILDSLIL
jgi:hypothetical protein